MADGKVYQRFEPDRVFSDLADYVLDTPITSSEAYHTAWLALMDALGCAFQALKFPACTRLLGPIVPGTVVPFGARVPGTGFILDPVTAAFNLGTMIRWLDFNDTFLAAEWGHPSDNLGGILPTADWLSRNPNGNKTSPITIREVLTALIKAYEIQGIISLENSFNQHGLDHVLLVKIATTAVAAAMLGCNRNAVINAISNAWTDGGCLRTYRHAPNTGSRKSWAAGDAASRGVRLALMARAGEMGYPAALTTPTWGFYDVFLGGHPLTFSQPYGSFIMENVLFKAAFPAEFHAQTAVEAAIQLHPIISDRFGKIDKILITTQEPALRIIVKEGPLHNPADRDHCLQYMVAVALIHGQLTAADYEDHTAADPSIDSLRAKMIVVENPQFSKDYLDPQKRSITNQVQVFFDDGSSTPPITVEYPLGHRRRRQEALPLLSDKFRNSLNAHFSPDQANTVYSICQDEERLLQMPVSSFVDHLYMPGSPIVN